MKRDDSVECLYSASARDRMLLRENGRLKQMVGERGFEPPTPATLVITLLIFAPSSSARLRQDYHEFEPVFARDRYGRHASQELGGAVGPRKIL